jgi:5'(3')-deoxyribonucleotidase
MFTYYVTFRIHDATVNGASYQTRYDALMKNVRLPDQGFWTETTSFILAESNLNTHEFAESLIKNLSPTHDLIVVADPTDKSASYFGKVEHLDVLKSFFPRIKKIG